MTLVTRSARHTDWREGAAGEGWPRDARPGIACEDDREDEHEEELDCEGL